jgi:putative OmpL-like beta-barrel porin-2
MKCNLWTLALLGAGVVSLPSVAKAEEKMNMIQTALDATTISGYVDTSAHWNPGTGNANPAPYAFNAGKQDGFNLNSFNLEIQKPVPADAAWGAGYTAMLMFGPDAPGVTGAAGEYVREAHVDLSVPIGNGLQIQFGRFGNVIGYESTTSYLNPNYTHSYAWSIQPTEHTGILATYTVCPYLSIMAGLANEVTTGPINEKSQTESKKAIVSLITITAPTNTSFLSGSTFSIGLDHGPGAGQAPHDRTHLYLGATINTPVTGLVVGAEYDSIWETDVAGVDTGYGMNLVGYVAYKATEKLTVAGRAEYARGDYLGALADADNGSTGNPLHKVIALTGTVQYDLWKNVISRLELRWDHAADGTKAFGGDGALGSVAPDKRNEFTIAANLIYRF